MLKNFTDRRQGDIRSILVEKHDQDEVSLTTTLACLPVRLFSLPGLVLEQQPAGDGARDALGSASLGPGP